MEQLEHHVPTVPTETANTKNMEKIKCKSQSKKQLAKRYNVSIPTFNKWLSGLIDLNTYPNQRVFTPKQVENIYYYLGEPPD